MEYQKRLIGALTDLGRYFTALPRRNPRLRAMIPTNAIIMLNRGRGHLARSRRLLIPVQHQSRYTNVFHCCVHKTGSQWLRTLFGDLATYRYSGLMAHTYTDWLKDGVDGRSLDVRTFDRPFPANTIVSPLYVTYENYTDIPKLGPAAAFFVTRDPRNLVVSWYYSTKISHVPMGPIPKMRADLNALSTEDGLIYSIDHLVSFGQFGAMRSWASAARRDPEVLVLRYEDIRKSDPAVFTRLFEALDIRIPRDELLDLLQSYSFEKQSGRKSGEENPRSALRSGGASSWTRHFTDKVLDYYQQAAGDLAEHLGYPAS